MRSVAFSNVIQLKSLLTKREAQKVTEMVRFPPKKCGDNTVDLHVRTAGRQKGDEQILYDYVQALHW